MTKHDIRGKNTTISKEHEVNFVKCFFFSSSSTRLGYFQCWRKSLWTKSCGCNNTSSGKKNRHTYFFFYLKITIFPSFVVIDLTKSLRYSAFYIPKKIKNFKCVSLSGLLAARVSFPERPITSKHLGVKALAFFFVVCWCSQETFSNEATTHMHARTYSFGFWVLNAISRSAFLWN